MRTIKK